MSRTGRQMAQAEVVGGNDDGFGRSRSAFARAAATQVRNVLGLPAPIKTARHLIPLYSTACTFEEYARLCPADLKSLGLLERSFDKWPEVSALQQAAVRVLEKGQAAPR